MNPFLQLLVFQWGCILAMMALNTSLFNVTVVIAFGAGIGVGVGCAYVSRLFHIVYRLKFFHYMLCVVSGIVTVYCVIAVTSLTSSRHYALTAIEDLHSVAKLDAGWSKETYRDAFYRVKDSNLEDFRGVPDPGQPGSRIPMKNPQSRLVVGAIYADSSAKHYRWLDMFSPQRSLALSELLRRDIYAESVSFGAYPQERGLQTALDSVRSHIVAQLERFVWFNVAIDTTALLLILFLSFGVVSRSAYKAIKITT
jgi:hypothetical protein